LMTQISFYARSNREREGESPLLQSLEQDVKPFLCEMVIVGEDIRQSLTAHRLHGDAIRQAIMLIKTGSVKSEGIEKRGMALRHNGDVRIIEHVKNCLHGVFPNMRPGSAIEGQVLGQHFVNSIEMVITERPAEGQDPRMPLVTRIRECHQIKGIHE